jgi:hypothetical protein
MWGSVWWPGKALELEGLIADMVGVALPAMRPTIKMQYLNNQKIFYSEK